MYYLSVINITSKSKMIPFENICNTWNNRIKFFGCICFFIVFMQYVEVDGTLRLMQERAVVKFSNPEYITNVQVFTARRRRSDPYMTNITATIHQTWGNNVTSKFSYMLPSGNTIDMTTHLCEAIDKPWMLEFAKTYSNLTSCPTPPGTYRYYNVVIPPKNFPLPLPPWLKVGDRSHINIKFVKTANQELLLEIYGTVRVY